MLLRPTINQLYLLSIAPSNRPPHLKQPPSPNLPFSPSESIHQIIYPSNTRKACLPRQGFFAFSIRLPPQPSCHQMRLARICPRLAGHTQSAMHQFAHFIYAFLTGTPQQTILSTKTPVRLPLLSRETYPTRNRRTLLVFFKLHFNQPSTKQRLPLLAPKSNYHFTSSLY